MVPTRETLQKRQLDECGRTGIGFSAWNFGVRETRTLGFDLTFPCQKEAENRRP